MIDRDFIEQKIKLIKADIEELKALKPKKWENFIDDKHSRYICEHLVEHIINRAIDINSHLIVENKKAPPDNYEGSFINLAELKILPAGFARKIAKSAGLRNRLVHDYDDIKFDIFYASINDCLKQFPKYLQYVTNYLDKN